MQRLILIVSFLICLAPALLGQDIIKTKSNQKYVGKIVKVSKKNRSFVIKTDQGNMVAVKFADVLTVQRGNKIIDLKAGESYYLEVRRPYLPFAILGVASGVYSVSQFQEYQKRKDKFNSGSESGEQNLKDDSGEAMALGIVSGLVSLGSFYVAIRPLEVKVPIGKVKVSGSPMGNGVMLSLHF